MKTQDIPQKGSVWPWEKQRQAAETSGKGFTEVFDFSCSKQMDESKKLKETQESSGEKEESDCNEKMGISCLFWPLLPEVANNPPLELKEEGLSNSAARPGEFDLAHRIEIFQSLSPAKSLIDAQERNSVPRMDAIEKQAGIRASEMLPDKPGAKDSGAEIQKTSDPVSLEKRLEKQIIESFHPVKATKEPSVDTTLSIAAKSTDLKSVTKKNAEEKTPLNTDQKKFIESSAGSGEDLVPDIFAESGTEIADTASFVEHFEHLQKTPPVRGELEQDESNFSFSPPEELLTKLGWEMEWAAEVPVSSETPETKWVHDVESFIVEQMMFSEKTNGAERVSKARIQLAPEHLGELEIEVSLKNNKLTVQLVVDQAHTKEWLEHKMTELTVKLASQKIEVVNFHITLTKNEPALVQAETQGNPFFNKKEQEENKRKSKSYAATTENEMRKITNQIGPNTGHLSLWV